MTQKNKFGFAPLETKSMPVSRDRSVGPMGAAVRETAESLQEATEAKVEQRRRNAEDAKAFRSATQDGLLLQRVLLGDIATDDLPRDRLELDAVARSDAMEELKASIRARGQKEPIEVYRDAGGNLQLKKGWRRLTALTQLLEETGDAKFAHVVARVEQPGEDRLSRYIDMVEENVIREDLSFAEMAQLAITASRDPAMDGQGADALVNRLYGSMHKMKRSYVRSFVTLLEELGDALPFPKEVSRNLGVEVVRAMKAGQADVGTLRAALTRATTADDQARILSEFATRSAAPVAGKKGASKKEKFEFRVGETKATARHGEFRIVSAKDYSAVPRDRLEKAVRAFEAALEDGGNPRITTL